MSENTTKHKDKDIVTYEEELANNVLNRYVFILRDTFNDVKNASEVIKLPYQPHLTREQVTEANLDTEPLTITIHKYVWSLREKQPDEQQQH